MLRALRFGILGAIEMVTAVLIYHPIAYLPDPNAKNPFVLAAFTGSFMNWNFIMAGAASTNGLMLTLSILLILAWKVSGWYGLDRLLLPWLGTPWSRRSAVMTGAVPQPAAD